MTAQRIVVGTAAQADKLAAELDARHKAAAKHPHAAGDLLHLPRAKLAKLTPAELREMNVPASTVKAILEAAK